jgi:16S rRNA (cytidine1402-2'-O)-methyltransferase
MGFNVTLVSDAGTPCLSDPGYILVDKCIQGGVDVFSIPGPSGTKTSLFSHFIKSLVIRISER